MWDILDDFIRTTKTRQNTKGYFKNPCEKLGLRDNVGDFGRPLFIHTITLVYFEGSWDQMGLQDILDDLHFYIQ